MCIRLKERMGVENILRRDEEILEVIFERFASMENVHVLEGGVKKRLGIVAFIIPGAHYNLVVKMLNDRFGLQTRGGCSCAGTYGHRLLQVDEHRSYEILDRIRQGDLLSKPGWVRLSVHPTMTDAEIEFIMDAIQLTAAHWRTWAKDYCCDAGSGQFFHRQAGSAEKDRIERWFSI
jgi:selenocysteine lyase/cysteine desulfurase